MPRFIIYLLALILLTACVNKGLLHPVPAVASPEMAANITIHKAMPKALKFDELIFFIDDIDIYSFDKNEDFSFVLKEGNYIFGYKLGVFEEKCAIDVAIEAGINYIFNLKPDCVIEME
jgi:hypothetical protein